MSIRIHGSNFYCRFKFNNKSYERVCKECQTMKEAEAFERAWRYGDPAAGFRIDPAVTEWPKYTPLPRDRSRVLLEIGHAELPEFALVRKGVGKHERYDYIDGDGRLLLAVPLAKHAQNAPLTLSLNLESDYIVSAGASPETMKEIFNSGRRKPLETLRWAVPSDLQYGILYVEIRDRTPEDGFGAFFHGLELRGRQPRNENASE